MENFSETVKKKKEQLEDKLNGKIKNSNLSWGLVILIVAGVYAFFRLMKFIFYFFS